MEKIYMEKNNNKESFWNKLFKNNTSIVLSFVLAIVSILSLVAVGFNQVSFAVPDITSNLQAPFVTKDVDTTKRIIGTNNRFPVDPFYTEKDIPVFCLEYNINFQGGSTYQDGGEVTDYGLLYLTANLYPNKKLKDASGNELDYRAQTWITQTAIWIYLKKAGDAQNSNLTDEQIGQIQGETSLEDGGSSAGLGATKYYESDKPIYSTFGITSLINTALTNRNKPNKSMAITKSTDAISLTADEKYYQTGLFTVTGSVSAQALGTYNGYSLSLNGAPSGTIIVGENGSIIDDLNNISPSTKFYIRIPKDKVTEEKQTITVNVNGKFNSYEGRKFVSPGDQTITTVQTKDSVVAAGTSFEIVGSPDTGMSTAQSIYFIGLIVLLSGVGIIYANVKPAKSN